MFGVLIGILSAGYDHQVSITPVEEPAQTKQVFETKPAINTFKRPDRQFITNPPTGHITKLNWQISALYPKLMNSEGYMQCTK